MTLIARAVELLRTGGLVAFPTETVYGLGADATNPAAVARIFAVKGRPATNPTIVHVADESTARRFASQWPQNARRLARRFWPGPLTLVVPKSGSIPAITTAGGATVGLRSPNHPMALELLRAFDGAIAAPSANRSMRVSPTTADHVRRDLGSSVDMILDGGPCKVGIESTVLDLSVERPIILRLGSIAQRDIEAVIGQVLLWNGSIDPTIGAASPGQQAIHYSPRTPAYRFARGQAADVARWMRERPGANAAMLQIGGADLPDDLAGTRFSPRIEAPAEPAEYARQLYANLRSLDETGVEAMFIEVPPDSMEWAAVRDRLWRAARAID